MNNKIIGLVVSSAMLLSMSVIPAMAADTAATDKTSYVYGDTVKVTGTADTATAIIVANPAGENIIYDSVTGGDFTFTFATSEDTMKTGTYNIYLGTTANKVASFKLASVAFKSWKTGSYTGSVATTTVGSTLSVTANFDNLPSDGDYYIDYTIDSSSVGYGTLTNSNNRATLRTTREGNIYINAICYRGDTVDADNIIAEATVDSGDNLTVKVSAEDTTTDSGSSSSSTTTGKGTLASGVSGSTNMTVGISSKTDKYAANFTDLGDASWAADAITSMAKKGIVSGYSDTSFAPNASVTRAEFCKMISNLYGFVSSDAKFASRSFNDVATDAWYFPYIEVCSQLGIVNGYGNKTFEPNALISRQEMTTILYRATGIMNTSLKTVKSAKTFDDDASIYTYAKEAVSKMYQYGIVSGTTDTTFEPEAGATRAQAVVIINNLYTSAQ